ncbi:MAG: CHAT domain-containing protein [Pseudomonadota bacterium]
MLACAVPSTACEGERALPVTFEPSGEPAILLLEQQDLDVTIEVHGKSGARLINSPSGTNGYEFLYIPENSAHISLCARPTHENTRFGGWNVQVVPAARFTAEDIQSLILLSNAGERWATDIPEQRQISLESYIKVAESSGRWATTALVYATRGLVARLQEIRAQALIARHRRTLPGPLRYQRSLLLGHIAANSEAYSQSLAYLYRAKQEAEAWSNESGRPVSKDLSTIWNLIAEGHISLRQFDLADAALNQALQLAEGSASLSAEALNHRGYYFIMLARVQPQSKRRHLEESLRVHGEAEQLALASKNSELLAIIYNNIGTVYSSLGDFSNSRLYLARALEQTNNADAATVKPYIRINMGADAVSLGDGDQAIAYLGAALEGFSEGQPRAAADTICRLGTAARLGGKPERAKAYRELCLKTESGDSESGENRVYSWLEKAISEQQLGDMAGAKESIEEAFSLLDSSIQSELHAKVIVYHAFFKYLDDNVTAIAEFERARNIAVHDGSIVHVELLGVELDYWLATADIERALETAEQLIVEIERVHASILDSERLGPAWTAKNHNQFVALIEHILSPDLSYSPETALHLLERVRAISLRKAIANRSGRDSTDRVRLRMFSRLARESTNPNAGLNAYLAEFEARELLSSVKRGRLEKLSIPSVPTVQQIQLALSDKQRVLYYFMGARKVYRYDISRTNFAVSEIGNRQEVDALIALVRHEYASVSRETKSQIALANLILPPDTDGSEHWIIVPHKGMHQLPFSGLSVKATGQPAIRSVSVSVTPSLAALVMPKPKRSLQDRVDIAILADPVFSTGDQKLLLESEGVKDDLRAWADDLRRLPMTAIEAHSLVEQFSHRKVLSYTGPRASRATLATETVRNARILHLATHGYFRDSSPFSSGIALSVVNEQREVDPGFVTVTELSEFRFNNELVVINGCETALGVSRAGEGVVGMTRAFLTQGAHHVVSTLWPVSDLASAMFVKYFYTHLEQTQKVSEALRRAQLDLRRSPRYQHPFFWAPYVLTSVELDDRVPL